MAYLRTLPPGVEFIIGSIHDGTTAIKQVCDHHRIEDKENCGIDLNPSKPTGSK